MKKHLYLIFLLICSYALAHDAHYDKSSERNWKIIKENKTVKGSFYFYKDGKVFLENEKHEINNFLLKDLSKEDQLFVQQKEAHLFNLNQKNVSKEKIVLKSNNIKANNLLILLWFLISFGCLFLLTKGKNYLKYCLPILFIGISFTVFSVSQNSIKSIQTTTSPEFINDAFNPFRPQINTYWNDTYFYVESKGIPATHPMMVGISNHGWQQQVPIPQCYIGNNAWPIPLNPVISSNPIPVDSTHFTRGAIAVAVNGVPIFNYHTNTGVDSYIDGQLDSFGGHCGRADDYHYHIAPLHLYDYTTANKPIAFGLDGFAVYGNTEPDGTPMQVLDSYNGHLFNGTYHYHGTAAAPYMIGSMVGEVTEDATHQLIPQASAQPVRPGLPPLNGALITNCSPNTANNGYTLTYTLSGQTDSIVYNWSPAGNYTFNFYTQGNGTSTTQNYNGFVQCNVPVSLENLFLSEDKFSVYPNPSNGFFFLNLKDERFKKSIQHLIVYDIYGKQMIKIDEFHPYIDLQSFSKGAYFIKVKSDSNEFLKKIIIQ